jgi:hypothetical protein
MPVLIPPCIARLRIQPALAALVALTAAAFAYRSAMAKVNYDREVRNEEKLSAKTALMMQLRSAAEYLLKEFTPRPGDVKFEVFAEIIPESIPEFDDAWRQLHLLPRESMEFVENVRNALRICRQMIKYGREPSDDERHLTERFAGLKEVALEGRAMVLHHQCETIATSCEKLRDLLDRDIKGLPKPRL